jgi:hypothetical protein
LPVQPFPDGKSISLRFLPVFLPVPAGAAGRRPQGHSASDGCATQAWNTGNLDQFMQGYWQSDSLKFIGSGGITYGWQNTLDRYRKRYPDQAARGTLRFEILNVDITGKDAAFVIGRFFPHPPPAGRRQRLLHPPLAQDQRPVENRGGPHQLVINARSFNIHIPCSTFIIENKMSNVNKE